MSFDFDTAVAAPFRMQPGLRRLSPGANQLTPNRLHSRHLREKLAVLSTFPERALLCQAGFDARPALAELARHAAAEQARAWVVERDEWHARRLGWAVDADGQLFDRGGPAEIGACLASLAPSWRAAALLSLAFGEDFAVVDARSESIPWLAVALPSHWAPEEKVGRRFAEIHAPVADNRLVVGAAPALVKLVCAAQRWERFVWTISAHSRLHAHPLISDRSGWTDGLTPQQLADRAWWRSERQTFIPVPGANQAIFTIAVDLQPLTVALADPDRAAKVHAALATMSAAVLDYRGLTAVRDRLLSWLAVRIGRDGAATSEPKPA
jgi:hypothetical protein